MSQSGRQYLHQVFERELFERYQRLFYKAVRGEEDLDRVVSSYASAFIAAARTGVNGLADVFVHPGRQTSIPFESVCRDRHDGKSNSVLVGGFAFANLLSGGLLSLLVSAFLCAFVPL